MNWNEYPKKYVRGQLGRCLRIIIEDVRIWGYSERTRWWEMQITATQFRQNTCKILDEVIEKGVLVEIKCKGSTVRITSDKAPAKL